MKKVYFYYFFILLLASSCKSYNEIHFDVLRPAEFSVPPEIKSVVIVDNSYPFNADNAHFALIDGKIQRLDTVVVDSFPTVTISALQKELALRQFFDTVYVDTLRYNTKNNGSAFKTLKSSDISSICKKFNADAVLALEGAQYGTQITVQNMGEEYFSIMEAHGMVFWRLYDLYEDSPIYKTNQRDTLFWDGIGAEMQNSVSSFPSLKNAALELGGYLGATFTDKLVPFWEPVKRNIYVKGNWHFINAAEWIRKKNRYEAEKLWGYIYETGSNKEQARAANNIAVSLEARGLLKDAMEWAFKSYDAYKNVSGVVSVTEKEAAKNLYVDMVRRYRDQEKLNKQIGGQ